MRRLWVLLLFVPLLVFSTLREMGQQRKKKRGGAVRDRARFYDKNGKKAENKKYVLVTQILKQSRLSQ